MTQRCKVPKGVPDTPCLAPSASGHYLCPDMEFLRHDTEAPVTPLHEGAAVWGTFPHGSAGAWVLRMR